MSRDLFNFVAKKRKKIAPRVSNVMDVLSLYYVTMICMASNSNKPSKKRSKSDRLAREVLPYALRYITGDLSLHDIAVGLNCTLGTIHRMSQDEQWTFLRNEYQAAVRDYVLTRYGHDVSRQIQAFQRQERVHLLDAVDKLHKELGRLQPDAAEPADRLSINKVRDYSEAYNKLQQSLYRSYGIADKVDIAVDILSIVPNKRGSIQASYRVTEADYRVEPDAEALSSAQDAPRQLTGKAADGEYALLEGASVLSVDHSGTTQAPPRRQIAPPPPAHKQATRTAHISKSACNMSRNTDDSEIQDSGPDNFGNDSADHVYISGEYADDPMEKVERLKGEIPGESVAASYRKAEDE